MFKKAPRPLKLLVIIIGFLLTGLLLYLLSFILFIAWSFKVTDYCQKKAEGTVGNKWAELRVPNDEEKKQFPGLNDISYGFREQLKCEHDPATLQKFRGWF